ncbi:hypothetical protein MRX96_023756 [Rhipicephalus microplus]
MAKTQVEASYSSSKARRLKRHVSADDDAAGPSNEPTVALRPRSRPLKDASGAPKPVATTASRKLRKTTDATQSAKENSSTSEAAATKSPRVNHRKRSKSSSPSNTNGAAIEALKRRISKKGVSRGRQGHPSRSHHGGRVRKARSPESAAASWQEATGEISAAEAVPGPGALPLYCALAA